ncbi:MAG: PKD domain-containing protein, partial [Bacteroidota bacterium]
NQHPVHVFTNLSYVDVTYTVILTATSPYGCTDMISHPVIVHPTPTASFNVVPVSQVFQPDSTSISIANTSSAGTWNYLWDFGDDSYSSLQNPITHFYHDFGTYDIMLIVYSNYCSDTINQTVELTPPPPIAMFTGGGMGCAPLTVDFTNYSQFAESYTWDFGDGTGSSQVSPEHIYYEVGVFTVTLTVTGYNGDEDTYIGTSVVEVFQNPVAYFTVTPSVVYLPDQPIKCTNLSENANSYIWNFGDGGSSTEKNPTYYYTEEGEYDITLEAKSEDNCLDIYTIYRAVIAEAVGSIEFPNAFTPNPSGPNGGAYQPGAFNNDVFHPLHAGVIDYQLSIYNRWGELIFESTDPNIGWDGYYRGELCKQEVYVWKVKGTFANNQDFMYAGDVTLLQ